MLAVLLFRQALTELVHEGLLFASMPWQHLSAASRAAENRQRTASFSDALRQQGKRPVALFVAN